MLRLISAVFGLLFVVAVGSIALLLLARDTAPALPAMPELSADQRRWGMDRLHARLLAGTDAAAVEAASRLSAADVELLAILAAERLDDGRVRIALGDGRADVAVSMRFPAELGGWLNLDAAFVETSGIPALDGLLVGGLPVPKVVASWLFDRAIAGLKSRDLFAGIEFTPNALRLRLRPGKDIDAARGLLVGSVSEQDLALAEVAQQRLLALIEARADQHPIDAAELFSALIASGPNDGIGPVAENRAAILALAAYVNHRRIPDGSPLSSDSVVPLDLDGREDAARHFFTSAAVALQGGSELAATVSLAKELDDADGGTGFSFRDIAANRAGNRFSELAGSGPETAARVNAMARAGLSAADVMPPVDWLPETMSQATFRRDFGGRDGRRYQSVINEIDRSIDQLPVAQGSNGQ